MSRIRSVHPGLWTDESFVSVSPLARLLHIGIWNECDDQGAFEWKPITLKMRLLAVDNVDVSALLGELVGANMIGRYAVNGREYGAVRNFGRFQRPKKPKSSHPMPSEWRKYAASDTASSETDDDETPSGSPPPQSEPTTVGNQLPTSSPPVPLAAENVPQMEEEGGNKEEEEKEDRSLRSLPQIGVGDFDDWWIAYPRKVGKDAARRAYAAAIRRKATPEALATALAMQRWPADPQFIPHPATWLNGGRWQDDPDAAAPPQQPHGHMPRRETYSEERRRKLGIDSMFDDLNPPALDEETHHARLPH